MPMNRALLLPAALLALALAGCGDRGKTPAQEQATKDSAASVAPASDVPPTTPPATATAGAPTTDSAIAASAPPAATPSDRMPSAPPPAEHGNASSYQSCMRSAARARTTDERMVLERTCARAQPH
jgi:hypothetical protein